jgi:hypothetical protein
MAWEVVQNGGCVLIFVCVGGRGLQCFKLNGNHTENDRYWQKNNFLLFAKCLKMYSFFSHLHFKIAKSAIMTQKNFFF